jgi:hypothetical protein
MNRLLRLALALVAGATIGTAGFAMVGSAAAAASGQAASGISTISIRQNAELVSSPASGADVTVTYSCFPTTTGGKGGNFGTVTLSDLHGTFGSGNWSAICDDAKHTVVVFVQPEFPPAQPFVAGDAAARAQVYGASPASTSREVRLS